MPKYPKSRKRYRYAPYRKRRGGGRGAMVAAKRRRFNALKKSRSYIPRPLAGTFSPNGERFLTTLKWGGGFESDSASGQFYFRANSLVPDPTGQIDATLQPLGFDQYAALFQRYVVLMSKCTVRCSVAEDNRLASFYLTDTDDDITMPVVNTDTGVNRLIGMTGVKFGHSWNSHLNGNSDPLTLTAVYTPKKTLGVTPQDPNVQTDAVAGTTPSRKANFNLGGWNGSNPSSATLRNKLFFVFIEYKVMFFERLNPAASVV